MSAAREGELAPPEHVTDAVADALGATPAAWMRVPGGNTAAGRARARVPDGRTAFAKWATDDATAGWLRDEMRVLAHLEADFVPRVLGWRDGPRPVLVLEDLGDALWPPPWTEERALRGAEALARIAATPPPSEVPQASGLADLLRGWRRVEEDPAPFLALGLADEAWLAHALPILRAAEDAVSFDGAALLHNDARGDNMAFLPERVVLVDWNWAAVGPAELDLAYFANHVHAAGGPPPERLMPDDGGWAAVIAGFLASLAGLPPMPGTTVETDTVRPLQRAHLVTALPWAARRLGLPPCDPARPLADGRT